MRGKEILSSIVIVFSLLMTASCIDRNVKPKPRQSLFIGVDISGSFLQSKNFDDALDFLAHYLYAHLQGLGELEVPKVLFVGSIGGMKANEPKTFHPKSTFDGKSIGEIRAKLHEIFPKSKSNPFTDFNAFFSQIRNTVHDRKLVLRPITVLLLTDGYPDTPDNKGKHSFGKINVLPLEKLSRNITIRLLYTTALNAQGWKSKVRRRRVKMATQDAVVMREWNDKGTLIPGKSFKDQKKFFGWLQENVDFGVRLRRIEK